MRVVEPRVVLAREDPLHPRFREARELAEPRVRRRVEVQPTLDLVRVPLAAKPLRELDHSADLTRRMWKDVGLPPAETPHVLEEAALLTPPQGLPAHPVSRGALKDRLIDVRHVLGIAERLALSFQKTRQHVKDDEC